MTGWRIAAWSILHAIVLANVIWFLCPLSWWIHAGVLQIQDAVEGAAPQFTVARYVHRSFYGEWTAFAKDVDADVPACSGSGARIYRPGPNAPPPDVDLSWWIRDDHCAELRSGRYVVMTTYSVRPFPDYWISIFFFPRQTSDLSNIFEIHAQPNPKEQSHGQSL